MYLLESGANANIRQSYGFKAIDFLDESDPLYSVLLLAQCNSDIDSDLDSQESESANEELEDAANASSPHDPTHSLSTSEDNNSSWIDIEIEYDAASLFDILDQSNCFSIPIEVEVTMEQREFYE